MYSHYKSCDPWTAAFISAPDQVQMSITIIRSCFGLRYSTYQNSFILCNALCPFSTQGLRWVPDQGYNNIYSGTLAVLIQLSIFPKRYSLCSKSETMLFGTTSEFSNMLINIKYFASITLINFLCCSCAPSTPAHAILCYGHFFFDARSPRTVCCLCIQWNTKVCESELTF